MFYVYLLKVDHETMSFYIGRTENLDRRLEEHLRGHVYTTNRLKNPQLIYFEAYSNHELSKERERQLKRFGSAYTALLKRLTLK